MVLKLGNINKEKNVPPYNYSLGYQERKKAQMTKNQDGLISIGLHFLHELKSHRMATNRGMFLRSKIHKATWISSDQRTKMK